MKAKPLNFLDRIGPGTPAWNAFDGALDAWLDTPKGQRNARTASYKRYANCREHMIKCLIKAGAGPGVVKEWKQLLRTRCREDLADIEAHQRVQEGFNTGPTFQ